jgi:hypothetical protein
MNNDIQWINDPDEVVQEVHHNDDLHLQLYVVPASVIHHSESSFDHPKDPFNKILSTGVP